MQAAIAAEAIKDFSSRRLARAMPTGTCDRRTARTVQRRWWRTWARHAQRLRRRRWLRLAHGHRAGHRSHLLPSEFAREGRAGHRHLTRLATATGTISGIFDTLGLTLYETSMKGGDLGKPAGRMQRARLDNAGRASLLPKLHAALAEQHDIALRQPASNSKRLALSCRPRMRRVSPSGRDQLDLTTEGGRTTFAALMRPQWQLRCRWCSTVEEISSSTSG